MDILTYLESISSLQLTYKSDWFLLSQYHHAIEDDDTFTVVSA